MIKRNFHRLLSEGEGRQLAWLIGAVAGSFLLFRGIVAVFFRDWDFHWQDIAALYLDGGNFAGAGEHDLLRLLIALVGVFLFSALLISVFTNIFENISGAYRSGEARFRFRNHVLILGAGRRLSGMLAALRDNASFAGKEILVVTAEEVEPLRASMDAALADKKFSRRITYYHSDRRSKEHLAEACAADAALIYLIGEDGESDHDAANILCGRLLKEICNGSGAPVTCFMTLDMHSSMDIYAYSSAEVDSRLHMEIVSSADYTAEQLLVGTPFLPAPGPSDPRRLHLFIAGSSSVSRAFALVSAHICHFPNYPIVGKTVITLIDREMKEHMEDFTANYDNLFRISSYSYISETGEEDHEPDAAYGDFLDIEWQFVDGSLSSPFVREMLEKAVADPGQAPALAICYDDPDACEAAAVHLPRALYDAGIPIAVYQDSLGEVISRAVSTGRYGNMTFFGNAAPESDPLFLRRSLLGKRVNYIYDRAYGQPSSADPEEAWWKISHAHRFSSIASANAIPLRMRSFGLDPTREAVDAVTPETLESLSETEHRRWMASVLLTGYRAAPAEARKDRSEFKRLKKEKYIHLDIAPYDEIGAEADKDTILVKNLPFILEGRTPVGL